MSCNNKGISNISFRYQVAMNPNTHDLIHEHAHLVADSFLTAVDSNYKKNLRKYRNTKFEDLTSMAMAQNELIDTMSYKTNYYLSHFEDYLNTFLDSLQNTQHRVDELFKNHHAEVVNKTDVPGLDPRKLSQQFAKE